MSTNTKMVDILVFLIIYFHFFNTDIHVTSVIIGAVTYIGYEVQVQKKIGRRKKEEEEKRKKKKKKDRFVQDTESTIN